MPDFVMPMSAHIGVAAQHPAGVLLDDDGNPVLDESGNPVFEEKE